MRLGEKRKREVVVVGVRGKSQLWVESEEGRGSLGHIHFPLLPATSAFKWRERERHADTLS